MAGQDYAVTTWEKSDGLPTDTISAVTQTLDGFLWVGTAAGLVRFDGARFVVAQGAEELAGVPIRRLFTDRSGTLWIATADARIYRRGEGKLIQVATPKTVPGLVTTFAQHPDGSIWLGTDTGSAFRFHADRFEQVLPELAADRVPTQLAADVWGDGRLWFRRGLSVGFFEGTQWTQVSRDSAPPKRLGPMAPRRAGGLWLFAAEYRLDLLGRGQWPLDSKPYPRFMDPSCLLEDSGGRLWFGTPQQGLGLITGNESASRYYTGTGFPIDAVSCLFEDREGNLWVGGSSGGLARLTRWTFVPPPADAGLPSTAPACLTEDDEGSIWVNFAESGLWRFQGSGVTGPMPYAGRASRRTGWALHVGRDGTKWFAAYGGGLLSWRQEDSKLWTKTEGLPTNDIRALCEGPQGELWLGCVLGLVRFDGTNFTRVTLNDSWPRREVNALTLDREGYLWAGGRDDGAARWRDGTVQVFRTEQGLPSDEVRTFLPAEDGSTWIGTTRGVAWWRRGRMDAFDASKGLPDADVHSLVDDRLGHLWMGTRRGVLRVDMEELAAVADGRAPRITKLRNFGREAGLPSARMTRGQPGALRALDGRLWFATLKGLAVVNPAAVLSNPVRPEVFFEEVLIDSVVAHHPGAGSLSGGERRSSPRSPLQVPSDARRLEFHYTTPILTSPESVRFERRLDGIDDEWRDAGGERSAVYHGLRAGHYRLRVRAANNDGVWGEEGAGLRFYVAPVWWETVWFRIVGAMGFAGLIGGVFWLRFRVLERRRVAQQNFARELMARQETERKRIAAELHDGLGQCLSIIQNRAVLATSEKDTGSKSTAHLAGISQAATEALAGVREICQGLRPVELDRIGLSKTLQSVAQRLAEGSGLEIVAEIDPVDAFVPAENWIHVLRFVQEALNNVVKHARATEVRVTLREDENCLRLVISDNGTGFEPAGDTPARSLGLSTMEERARILGAELRIESAPGRGTNIRLRLPENRR